MGLFFCWLVRILFYGNKTDSIQGAVASIGAVFFFVFILVIPMTAGIVPLVEDRAVLYRETVSGTYSRLSYGLGLLVADIPFHMLNSFLMFISFYYLVEFGRDGVSQSKAEVEKHQSCVIKYWTDHFVHCIGYLFFFRINKGISC